MATDGSDIHSDGVDFRSTDRLAEEVLTSYYRDPPTPASGNGSTLQLAVFVLREFYATINNFIHLLDISVVLFG